MGRKFTMLFVGSVLATLVLAAAPTAWASTFAVTNTNDSGAGSLRQAIIEANDNPDSDTIKIGTTGTINLQDYGSQRRERQAAPTMPQASTDRAT